MSIACDFIQYANNKTTYKHKGIFSGHQIFYTVQNGYIKVFNGSGESFVIHKPVYQIVYNSRDILYVHYNGANESYMFYDPTDQFISDIIVFYCTDITKAGCKKKKNCMVNQYPGTQRVLDNINRNLEIKMSKILKKEYLHGDINLEQYL